VINNYDLNVIYVCGPGHGGPGTIANTYLENSYPELHTHILQTEEGLAKLFKQFSSPAGVQPSFRPTYPQEQSVNGTVAPSVIQVCEPRQAYHHSKEDVVSAQYELRRAPLRSRAFIGPVQERHRPI